MDSIKKRYDSDLIFEELKYIVTDQEYENYISLLSENEWIRFFKIFWLKRNPMPAADINERLTEHYRRFIYAEKYYEYDGFRTWFNSPDKLHYLNYPKSYSLNQEFNDRGLIFIRQGETNDKVVTLGEDVPVNESWRYYATQTYPEMTFHFLKENSPGNNWRLAPYISNPALLTHSIISVALYILLFPFAIQVK